MMNKSAPTALRRSKRFLQKEDLLTNLVHEMTREILGRLPIRSVMGCKSVCKSWCSLIEGGDFMLAHTSQPCLAFVHRDMGFAVCDEDCKPLRHFGFRPPHDEDSSRAVVGSANGLILVWDGSNISLCVCNPITVEYIKLLRWPLHSCIFGFGVSKISRQYKILCGDKYGSCHVYTLGRGVGSWRSVGTAIGCPRLPWENAAFLNGNLHWLICDSNKNPLVCCLDLETELFTDFSLPSRDYEYSLHWNGEYRLCVLEGQLCLCDIFHCASVVIWQMINYGDPNSWVKAYTVGHIHEVIFPLKVLANENLLFAEFNRLYIYSKNDERPVRNADLHRSKSYFSNIVTYIPSFLSFKAMGICNVQSLSFY